MACELCFVLELQPFVFVMFQQNFAEQAAVQNHSLVQEVPVELSHVISCSHQFVSYMGLDSVASS